ncbi:helix-turn-helix domain-containing protein [uncultured Sunxiuqinia sp.]|uniref:helix-turn-helix domain-containing protein n=1 Tax=uncultured Sunxiuqinia sp. TaxID=1573825 RepID=UPI00262F4779|nr:helix-turn-helix domain-containing protein [uncultured Sunxiuqinia sp.]
MPDLSPVERDFLKKITAIVTENIGNDQFGVSELAREAGMSRSNLLRKIKKLTNLSVSLFIRQIRLEKAMELLKEGSLTVSEVAFQVGFSSTSYFGKCFHDHYGYPPGEQANQEEMPPPEPPEEAPPVRKSGWMLAVGAVLILAVLVILFKPFAAKNKELEKSIAVLPFKNESNDSTNIYLINGLMESILNNLQKIENLRVVSRTSVEKYRHSSKSIPEIAEELGVSYFIEGSGQKIGDQILLSVQLIEAPSDKHVWSEQYQRETRDIFNLQLDVAKSITQEIEVIITPEEQKRISKPPTDNLEAYDYFLKGLDEFHQGTREGLELAIPLFKQAVEHDPEFARAYADLAIAYYMLDAYQAEKNYVDEINAYADLAMFYDDQLSQSLLAKAFFYINTGEYELAIPYLEKALEYSPNSAFVINTLSDFYTSYYPNTGKYLEYALKGIQIDVGGNDSTTTSFILLHLSNAFIQSGFVDEAEKYINQSLAYSPGNLYSMYVKAYIQYAKTGNLPQLKTDLLAALEQDSTRFDILQEVAKSCYYLRDYESAYTYYRRFLDLKKALNLDVYRFENGKIAVVMDKMGFAEEAAELMQDYKAYAEQDPSIYRPLSLAVYYAWQDDRARALQYLEEFAREDNFHYWTILFLDKDPLVDSIKELPEFRKLFRQMEQKFWNNHQQLKRSLEAKNLL